MPYRYSLIIAAAVLSMLAPPTHAQNTPAPTLTLAQSLAQISTPPRGVVLTVNAGETLPPKSADSAPQAATLEEIAAAFGRVRQEFGPVTALAPASQTVLNADPADPNPFLDMDRNELLTLLSSTLTDAQWQTMTSSKGVALSALTGTDQKQILDALFPATGLRVEPVSAGSVREMLAGMADAQKSGKPYSPAGLRDVTPDLPRAFLRLGQRTAFMLPTGPGGAGGYSGGGDDTSGLHYTVFDDAEANALSPHPTSPETLYGIRLSGEIPNALKAADLDYDAPALRAIVPLPGLKTVGALVTKISTVTHLEIYADPHLANKTLTLLGKSESAPASDLLRALALCVTGTYRAVGSAFVLTEDLAGAGVIHQRWADVQRQMLDQRQTLMTSVSTTLMAHHSPSDLLGLGDPADLTPSQRDLALKPGGVRQGDAIYPPGTLFLPFSKLTPGQQDTVRRGMEQREEMVKLIPGLGAGQPDLKQNISLTVTPTWQLVLPSLDGPVTLGDLIAITNLFAYPPMGAVPLNTETPAGPPAAAPPPAPKPLLTAALAPFPRRAVLAEVDTPQQVDSLVASLRTVGLNQLWLVTFSRGVDHSDLLTEALRVCKGTHIAVYAVLDLLTWGSKTPGALRDRNLFGEDSAQAYAHLKRTEPDWLLTEEGMEFTVPTDQLLADPTNPAVQKKLTLLVKTLAAQPGLAGLVWRGDESPGYDPLTGLNSDDDDRRLGYGAPVRLAFLRQTGADPLDVPPNRDALGIDGLLWRDGNSSGAYALTDRWSGFPAGANHALLGSLSAAVRSVAPALPIVIRQRHDSDIAAGWYGSWDNPRKPPPTYHSPQDQGPFAVRQGQPGTVSPRDIQASSQSRLSWTLLSGWAYTSASELAQDIQDETEGQRWDGFVLDFTQSTRGAKGDPLAELARSIAAAHAPEPNVPIQPGVFPVTK